MHPSAMFSAHDFLCTRRQILISIEERLEGGWGGGAQATLSDAMAVLRSSPMIFALSLMVISYGVGHRLFEFAWKGQLRMLYPSAMAYQV